MTQKHFLSMCFSCNSCIFSSSFPTVPTESPFLPFSSAFPPISSQLPLSLYLLQTYLHQYHHTLLISPLAHKCAFGSFPLKILHCLLVPTLPIHSLLKNIAFPLQIQLCNFHLCSSTSHFFLYILSMALVVPVSLFTVQISYDLSFSA